MKMIIAVMVNWMVMNMIDTFKPVVEGMEFHAIDGTGFPDAVLVSNGGNVMDGTYIDKYYYPVVHAHWKYDKNGVFWCSRCECIPATKSDFCPNCGAKIDGDEHE